MNLLLLSSSRVDETDYLAHAESYIKAHLNGLKEVLFVPFAGIADGFDRYEEKVAQAFKSFGFEIHSLHRYTNMVDAVKNAQAIAVGGGNTFCLLNALYENDLIQAIQEKVKQGTPYIGWSAGSNITAPTIRTTNDMPIVEPPSFNALNLIPFQINPHYIDGNPPGHNGETREMRISEFLITNPTVSVVGIPEGTALLRNSDSIKYIGSRNGFIFTKEDGKKSIAPNSDLSDLLR